MRNSVFRPTMPGPDLAGDGARAGLSVTAQPVSSGSMPAANNAALDLAQALRPFSQHLDNYFAKVDKRDLNDAQVAGKVAGEQASVDDPVKALSSVAAMPDYVQPAYKADFAEGYRESVGSSIAAKSGADMIATYNAHKNDEGFAVEPFLRDFTQKQFAGIDDPIILESIAKQHAHAASAVRTDFAGVVQARVRETNERNLQQTLDAQVRSDLPVEQLANTFHNEIVPMALKTGQFTRTELSERFVNQLHILSEKAGGKPELFDAADTRDANGISPSMASPALAQKVEQERLQAQAKRDAHLGQQNLESNSLKIAELSDRMDKEDYPSDAELAQLIGPGSVFSSKGEYQAFRAKRDALMYGDEQTKIGMKAYQNGEAWTLDSKVAKAAYDKLAASPTNDLLQNLGKSDADSTTRVNTAVTTLLGISQRGNLGHISDPLKKRIDAFTQAVPGQQPDPAFVQMAGIRAAMKDKNPTLADKYFDEHARDLFDSYNDATSTGGSNSAAAYAGAYLANSPEAKKRVQDMIKADPQFDQKIAAKVSGVTTDWNFFRSQWMGTYPTNEDRLQAESQLRVKEMLTKNPNLGVTDAIDKVKSEMKAAWVYEPTLNMNVRVGNGLATDTTRDALTRWVKDKQATWGNDSGLTIGVSPTGALRYQTTNPTRVGEVPLSEVIAAHATATTLQPTDLPQIDALRQKMTAGTVTRDDAIAAKPIIDKLKGMGKWSMLDSAKLAQYSIPNFSADPFDPVAAPKPSNDYAGTSNVDNAKVKPMLDNKSEVANRFLQMGNPYGALTAMGEGVALTAYQGPEQKVGMTIGMGYTQAGNAKTWQADFKAAGIDVTQGDAIWRGEKSITREQAMRLYQVAQPRYVANAAKSFGDGWEKLPDNQKAVLADLAWQVGDLSSFPKAIAAFKRGDLAAADKEIAVSYTDRSGARKSDIGRHSLRSNMLAGPVQFTDLLNSVGPTPTNRTQVATQ